MLLKKEFRAFTVKVVAVAIKRWMEAGERLSGEVSGSESRVSVAGSLVGLLCYYQCFRLTEVGLRKSVS